MQAGTHSAILCKLGNGRHIILTCGHAHHVERGHKTLQMCGFPIQTYGKTLKCNNFNSDVNQKSLQISSFDPFCVPI